MWTHVIEEPVAERLMLRLEMVEQLDLWIKRGAWQPQVEALFGDKRCMVTSGGGTIWG